jgi:hypothetical protein
VAPGPGGPPVVKVFSGANGGVLAQVTAGPTGAIGGVTLTASNLGRDGLADLQASL